MLVRMGRWQESLLEELMKLMYSDGAQNSSDFRFMILGCFFFFCFEEQHALVMMIPWVRAPVATCF
jgi:hypothetical protein